jgi:hypothetical protein
MAKRKEIPLVRVRFPPGVFARLERDREKAGRTLTGEIVHRIQESWRRDETAERLEAHEEKIKQHIAEAIGEAKAIGEQIVGAARFQPLSRWDT